MKILFMLTRDWLNPTVSGGGILSTDYARYLAGRGHTVTILSSTYSNLPKEQVIDGVKIIRLGRPISLWYKAFFYYMFHCRGKYDIVIEEAFGGSRIPMAAPLYVRTPMIVEWHHIYKGVLKYMFPKLLVYPAEWLERLMVFVHRNCFIRAGTEEVKDDFIKFGFKKEKTFVVPVDLREDWFDSPKPVAGRTHQIIWLGVFQRWKCPDHVARAFQYVLKSVPDARLILAGKQHDLQFIQELKDLVDSLGIAHAVDFRFNISEEEKRQLFEQSRSLIMSSPVEGFGIVALEAGACGTPVIASSGVPESVVKHGYNGLRYQFSNVTELSERICTILNDEILHDRLAENNRAFARRFTWSHVGAQFEEALEMVLNSIAKTDRRK